MITPDCKILQFWKKESGKYSVNYRLSNANIFKLGIKNIRIDAHQECFLCLGKVHIPTTCKACEALTPKAHQACATCLKSILYDQALGPVETSPVDLDCRQGHFGISFVTQGQVGKRLLN
uniref:Uncharacterized protein n=1 Tax=Sphaerodactylus townsendi TaxID=933632 RepID=A0ACB8FAC3_9SAUR